MGEKCPNLMPARDTHDSGTCDTNTGDKDPSQTGQQVHKWPLRPGVHVHVNGLNTLTGGQDSKVNHQISGFTYGAKTSRSSSSSGSDWASNTSSNPDLNTSDQSETKHRSSAPVKSNLATIHQELANSSYAANDLSSNGSRPNSRQARKKRDVNKNLSHISGSDQLLPTFYENVSSIQNRQKVLDERLRDTRSHSPALTMGHVDTRPASVQHVAAGHVSAYDTRPASQLSAHTLHAYGSSRSSTSSKHVPRPGHQRNLVIPGAKYSALHTNCRQKQHDQRKMDLAEAELESNPEERDTGRDPDVLIEYSAPTELPLFSSLNSYKSLPRGPPGHVPPHVGAGSGAILLSEPISPPKQFDSSYTGYSTGLRVQPHSIHASMRHAGPGHVRDETY